MVRNEDQANVYIAQITNPGERALMGYFMSVFVGHVTKNAKEYAVDGQAADALLHVKAAHAALSDWALVMELASGRYERFEDVPDLF